MNMTGRRNRLTQRLLAAALAVCVCATGWIWAAGPPTVQADETSDLQAQIAALEARRQEAQQQAAALQDDIDAQQELQENLQSQIDVVEQQVTLYQAQIDSLGMQIQEQNQRIESLNMQMAASPKPNGTKWRTCSISGCWPFIWRGTPPPWNCCWGRRLTPIFSHAAST